MRQNAVHTLDLKTLSFWAMRKAFNWIRDHPIVAAFGYVVLALVSAHFFLNWRAERRWQAYAAEAHGRGVS
jgi:hypothetical protein